MGEDCINLEHSMFRDAPVRKQSQVIILHSARKAKTDSVVHAAGKIFGNVCNWRSDEKQLRRWKDTIEYYIVQLAPWLRGGGAIIKFVDGVMQKIHGRELEPYHPEKLIDLEIYANVLLRNFLKYNPDNYKYIRT
jgi:hypothetical protein